MIFFAVDWNIHSLLIDSNMVQFGWFIPTASSPSPPTAFGLGLSLTTYQHLLIFTPPPSSETQPPDGEALSHSSYSLTCGVCGKTLSRKSTLVNHMKKVHGQDGLVPVATSRSSRRRSLSRHKTRSSARMRWRRIILFILALSFIED